MRSFSIAIAALLAGLLFTAFDARAFSVDETTATNSDGSARFSDPDDKAEQSFGLREGQPINNDGAGNTMRFGPMGITQSVTTRDCTVHDRYAFGPGYFCR